MNAVDSITGHASGSRTISDDEDEVVLPDYVDERNFSAQAAPHKRTIHEVESTTTLPEKRRAYDNMMNSYTCPIQHVIFSDPVMMADGHTYERVAAEQLLRNSNGGRTSIKSPITGYNLSHHRLTTNKTLRSAIVYAIESNTIGGDLVRDWEHNQKVLKWNARQVENLQKMSSSKGGNGSAALKDLGLAHLQGWYGLDKDDGMACALFKKAADQKNVTGMALYGFMAVKRAAGAFSDASGKINGTTIGMVYVAMAAVQGSEFACSLMARAHELGLHGLNIDKSQAKEWYYKMDQCEHKDADERARALRDKFIGNDSSDEDEGDDEGEGED